MPILFGYFAHLQMSTVAISHLSKSFSSGLFRKSNIQALSDVSITVSKGEIFGLLGPNGAGKTTLVKILLSVVHPTSGTATILGQPMGSTGIRERIGYLPENHRYPSFLTAHQTLLHFGRLQGLSKHFLSSKASELLRVVGLEEWSRVKIKKFSKGMLQRLGLAQALLNDPEVLFLDEPTDGVDPVGRKEIRDILKGLRSAGKTVFLNSHLLSEVEEISDRVAILNKGEVLSVGTIRDITSHALEYEIRLGIAPSEPVLQKIGALSRSLETNQLTLTLALHAKEDLNKILQILLQEGMSIESVMPRKSRLEDFFINLIRTRENP
ncbi:MAG: ABC transporter ATP-binding protein [Ignavibacteriales bacterium]|nr:ABC transporter ATP-binding protein [Ignavibacteriales bacterium]